jgi:hypothetical protein
MALTRRGLGRRCRLDPVAAKRPSPGQHILGEAAALREA